MEVRITTTAEPMTPAVNRPSRISTTALMWSISHLAYIDALPRVSKPYCKRLWLLMSSSAPMVPFWDFSRSSAADGQSVVM